MVPAPGSVCCGLELDSWHIVVLSGGGSWRKGNRCEPGSHTDLCVLWGGVRKKKRMSFVLDKLWCGCGVGSAHPTSTDGVNFSRLRVCNADMQSFWVE